MNRSHSGAALAVCALAGLLATGCGGSGTHSTDDSRAPAAQQSSEPAPQQSTQAAGTQAGGTPDSSPAAQQQSARPAWCTTAALKASLRQLNPAAGSRYTALVLTNTSGSSCRTQGYPGLQLVAAGGGDVPTDTVRDRSQGPVQLTLKPGGSAWARLQWSQVTGEGESTTGRCEPIAAVLEVIPPDQRTHTDVRWPYGEVCSSGRIIALPLAAGAGPAR